MLIFLLPCGAFATDTGTPTRYGIDQRNSWIRIYVYRAGLLSLLGHDHLISTSAIDGGLTYRSPPSPDAVFKLAIPADGLVVDDPDQRKLVGGRFAGPVADKDRDGTRRNMLSAKVLDVAHYPEVTVSGHWIEGSSSHGAVAATIGLRDAHRQYRVPVDLQEQNARLVVTGVLHIKQTELGIVPLSILGGMLNVADAVDVRFSLTFTPLEGVERSNSR